MRQAENFKNDEKCSFLILSLCYSVKKLKMSEKVLFFCLTGAIKKYNI